MYEFSNKLDLDSLSKIEKALEILQDAISKKNSLDAKKQESEIKVLETDVSTNINQILEINLNRDDYFENTELFFYSLLHHKDLLLEAIEPSFLKRPKFVVKSMGKIDKKRNNKVIAKTLANGKEASWHNVFMGHIADGEGEKMKTSIKKNNKLNGSIFHKYEMLKQASAFTDEDICN